MKKKTIGLLLVLLNMTLCVVAQNNTACEELKGKRIGVIGDSYVRNHKQPQEYTWHYKFAKKYGMEYFNYGRNGNCIAYNHKRFGTGIYERYTTMSDSLDYVVVIGGHNDAGMLDSIGGIDVFKEKMSILCEGLVTKYPTAKIFFFTRWICDDFAGSNSEKVVDAMIEVCGNYSIPIFDAARKSGVFANVEAFRRLYFQSKADTAHLNDAGHDRFLKVAEDFIIRY